MAICISPLRPNPVLQAVNPRNGRLWNIHEKCLEMLVLSKAEIFPCIYVAYKSAEIVSTLLQPNKKREISNWMEMMIMYAMSQCVF